MLEKENGWKILSKNHIESIYHKKCEKYLIFGVKEMTLQTNKNTKIIKREIATSNKPIIINDDLNKIK